MLVKREEVYASQGLGRHGRVRALFFPLTPPLPRRGFFLSAYRRLRIPAGFPAPLSPPSSFPAREGREIGATPGSGERAPDQDDRSFASRLERGFAAGYNQSRRIPEKEGS